MKEILMAILGNPLFIPMVFFAIVVGIGLIIKKTKTKKDDEIYAMILRAFQIGEKLIPNGTENKPKWLQKSDEALKYFNKEYSGKYGVKVPDNITEIAKDQWTILSQELKKK